MAANHNNHSATDEDTGHEYDGIRELDNNLPAWWLTTLWVAVVFGIGYWGFYETTGAGMTALEALAADEAEEAERAVKRLAKLEKEGKAPWVNDDKMYAFAARPEVVARGKAVYDVNCAACHRADGGGVIGPNLTDNYAIHGGNPLAMFAVVKSGIAAKGMPAWEPVIGIAKTADVVAYVMSLQGKPAADGKAADGKPFTPRQP